MPKLEDEKIASRYAKALFESVLEAADPEQSGQVAAVQQELESVAALIKEVPQLSTFFTNPAIPHHAKVEFTQSQFIDQVGPWVGKLMRVMVENNRLGIFLSVVQQYQALHNKHNNIATAEVISAVELDEKQLNQFRDSLSKRFGFSRVDIHNRVEPGILGGAIVKIQDQLIDGSYSGKLETLKKQLA